MARLTQRGNAALKWVTQFRKEGVIGTNCKLHSKEGKRWPLLLGCLPVRQRLDSPPLPHTMCHKLSSISHLIDVQLDKEGRHALAVFAVVLADAVHCLRHKLQHQVQEDLVLLCGGVEAVLELHHVAVVHHLHDLQLPVLEALVLQHLLDRNLHATRRH